MAKPSAGRGLSSGSALFLWVGTIAIDLFAVLAIVHGASSDSLLFGRTGTTVLLLAVVVFAVVAAGYAWRGVSGPGSVILAGGQFVGAAIILVMWFGFLGGDGTKASSVTPLLLYCIFAEAMIGAGVLQSARRQTGSTKGR